jgi:hypothetical protein
MPVRQGGRGGRSSDGSENFRNLANRPEKHWFRWQKSQEGETSVERRRAPCFIAVYAERFSGAICGAGHTRTADRIDGVARRGRCLS